jgi:hypothetical protein
MGSYPGDVYRSVLMTGDSRLAGTGLIADDLWLIAHHEVTGRPHLSPRAAGVAMAGGLLAELMTARVPALTLRRGYVLPLHRPDGGLAAGAGRPGEPVAGHVLDVIRSEPAPRPARDWLLFLGRTSAADVAGRLGRSGYLARQPSRLPWRAPQPVPVNAGWSHYALMRAHGALEAAKTLTAYSALLTGLVLACGLGFRFAGFPGTPGRTAKEAARALPRPLRELIAQVQVTADSTVLSNRK